MTVLLFRSGEVLLSSLQTECVRSGRTVRDANR